MKKAAQLLLLGIVLSLLSALCGCGGGGASTPATPISVAIAEDSVALGAGQTHQFTVTVTGTTNTAVTWGLSGCNGSGCGTISAAGLYTAPAVVTAAATITLTATSQADLSKSDTAVVNHMPISVSIAPGGAWVMPGKTVGFSAAARYDKNNAGVTWALRPQGCGATCGTLSKPTASSVSYTAPESMPQEPNVTLTATSITDPNQKAEVVIKISDSSALVEGDYAFMFNGWEIRMHEGTYWSYEVAASGHFHADANGNITHGVEDINSYAGVSQSVPFTGTYGTGPDRRGTFIITTAAGTDTYEIAIEASGSKGRFIKSNGLPIMGAGYFELQDPQALSSSSLAGEYAVGIFGSEDWNRVAAVGRFSASPAGSISGGKMDLAMATHINADPQSTFQNLLLTGSFGAPAPGTGRGTATLALSPAPGRVQGNLQFVYYIVSAEKIFLVQTDTRNSTVPVLSGEIRRQTGPFSAAFFAGPSIFSMTGVNRANYGAEIVHATIGQMIANGAGSMTGVIDDNGGQFPPVMNKAFTGSYAVAPNGRATLRLGSGDSDQIAYFFAPKEAFLMQSAGTDVLFGRIQAQAAESLTAASIQETFVTATTAPASEQAENDCGVTSFNGAGEVMSAMEVTRWDELSHFDLSGTYTVSANGRGTLTFGSPASNQPVVFWVISPTELVGLGKIAPLTPWSALLEYEK